MRTALLVAAVLAVGVYGVVVGILAWQQRRLLYIPNKDRPDLPVTQVVNASKLTVTTRDGLKLLAWFVPPADDTQPVILYLHGNGGNLGNRSVRFATMSRLGWGVWMQEYRGYGGNPGTPTETGLSEDAHAAYFTLRQQGVPPSHIVLWGESLGTGVAVQLAAKVDVAAVLLESPYTSIAAVAQKRFPLVPVHWLLLDRFDTMRLIGAVHSPVLVMTGGRDAVVPPSMGQAVFKAANEPKAFWFVPEAGHNDLLDARAFDAARSFLRQHGVAPGKE